MKYLLDTDICIYIIKQRPATVFERFRELSVGDIGISAITYSELCFGVYKSQKIEQNLEALQAFVSPLEIVPYSDSAGIVYGKIRSQLERNGTPIGPLDTLIAAQALSEGFILVSNNVKEFSRIPGLALEIWV